MPSRLCFPIVFFSTVYFLPHLLFHSQLFLLNSQKFSSLPTEPSIESDIILDLICSLLWLPLMTKAPHPLIPLPLSSHQTHHSLSRDTTEVLINFVKKVLICKSIVTLPFETYPESPSRYLSPPNLTKLALHGKTFFPLIFMFPLIIFCLLLSKILQHSSSYIIISLHLVYKHSSKRNFFDLTIIEQFRTFENNPQYWLKLFVLSFIISVTNFVQKSFSH